MACVRDGVHRKSKTMLNSISILDVLDLRKQIAICFVHVPKYQYIIHLHDVRFKQFGGNLLNKRRCCHAEALVALAECCQHLPNFARVLLLLHGGFSTYDSLLPEQQHSTSTQMVSRGDCGRHSWMLICFGLRGAYCAVVAVKVVAKTRSSCWCGILGRPWTQNYYHPVSFDTIAMKRKVTMRRLSEGA